MALTAPQFLSDRPEFAGAGVELVAKAMRDARVELDAEAWGTAYDQALSLLTAHKLWSSPFGESMRLDGSASDGSSRYLTALHRMQMQRIPRIMVLR